MLITVVIPTLNEADHIADTLASIQAQPGPYEVVVVDGGSEDRTLAMVSTASKVIQTEPGRSNQMNAGAAAATGDVILFLHADTILPQIAFASVREAVTTGAAGGIFRLQFDEPTFLLRLSSYATRFKLKSICFGDRAIFARADLFRTVGGFPEIPIFEDLEFVRLLTGVGTFRHLNASVITSSRRYLANGDWRQQWSNARLWFRYRNGADLVELSDKYRYPK